LFFILIFITNTVFYYGNKKNYLSPV